MTDTAVIEKPDTGRSGLVRADRCDRCGAQAWIVATMGDSELLFCMHEGNVHKAALEAQGFEVSDHTEGLYKEIAQHGSNTHA